MSAEQPDMYTEPANEDQLAKDHQQQQEQTQGSPSAVGSKRKRDEETPSAEEVAGQERRASLKRTIAASNATFMAVNQSAGPPTAPMAFANVGQPPAVVNGTDPSAGIHGLGTQLAVSQPPPIGFSQESAIQDMNNPYGQISAPQPPPPDQLPPPQLQVPQMQGQLQGPPMQQQQAPQPGAAPGHHVHVAPPAPPPKPQVGTEEWHQVRRNNHKEVERRRRETINEGINELAKIVPGCEKNKGSILQRAVQYIQQLKENEATNIEKWTLEKLLTEQAIAELTTSNEKLKTECERAWREAETWKKMAAEPNRNVDSTAPSS